MHVIRPSFIVSHLFMAHSIFCLSLHVRGFRAEAESYVQKLAALSRTFGAVVQVAVGVVAFEYNRQSRKDGEKAQKDSAYKQMEETRYREQLEVCLSTRTYLQGIKTCRREMHEHLLDRCDGLVVLCRAGVM